MKQKKFRPSQNINCKDNTVYCIYSLYTKSKNYTQQYTKSESNHSNDIENEIEKNYANNIQTLITKYHDEQIYY